MTAPIRPRDALENESVSFAESRIARLALADYLPRVLGLRFSHGMYHLTIRIGTDPQTLADADLLTLFARATRLLADTDPTARTQDAA